MNAFEVRKYLMSNAKSIMDEADDRIDNNIDPLTGEPWTGDNSLFRLRYKTLLQWAGKSNDPLPETPKNMEYIDRVQKIINMMLDGRIDSMLADHMLKPILGFMSAVEIHEAREKIDELRDMVSSARNEELSEMSDDDLEREIEQTEKRLDKGYVIPGR